MGEMHGDQPENGYTFSRHFKAPRALVYEVWSSPEHRRQWLAPKDFHQVEVGGDPAPGAPWFAVIRSPGGKDHRMEGKFLEVIPGERIVQTHQWINDDGPGVRTIITVTFEDDGDGTRMTFTQTGFTTEDFRASNSEGWSEAVDSFGAYLKRQAA